MSDFKETKSSTNTWTPERRKEYDRKWCSDRRKERSAYFRALKVKQGCSRCGYKDHPVALDFHHRDPAQKKFNISNNLVGRNWEKILAEVDKCDIVCANCHRIEHDTGVWDD
jgi:hypothetical protein